MPNTVNDDPKDCLIVCRNSHGMELRATLLRLTRFIAVFEIYTPSMVLRTSEVLSDFRIVINDRSVYSGRAVISNLVHTGSMTVCEAKLDESNLNLIGFVSLNGCVTAVDSFKNFLADWQKLYKVLPEFKVVVADMQSFLSDLKLWLDQVELEIRSSPSADRLELERKVVDELAGPIVQAIDTFIDRFETIAGSLEPDLEPVHRTYLRRLLHPLVLCSPFAHRTYHKPLGYAGDYEVVDMMIRPPHEGSTLFAKIINVWLLGQSPAQAHRNRVAFLEQKLVEETLRVKSRGRTARVFNLGCGPAAEVQHFLKDHLISDQVKFTLFDFNEETLSYLRRTLEDIKHKYNRNTSVQLVKKSVHQILKEGGKTVERAPENQYDFVYCAGLFDYLSNQVCKKLMNILYDMVAPGGLLLATNVSDAMNRSRPFRYSMEYILDWHLIYRGGPQVAALSPDRATADDVKIISEDIGVNVFIEVRKPDHD